MICAIFQDHKIMHLNGIGTVIAIAVAVAGGQSKPAKADCDDLIDRLVRAKAEPALANINCGALGKAGVDHLEHELKSVCYTSTGRSSKIEVEASVTCKTSDAAMIHVSLTGKATASAEVRGADCQITSLDLKPSGDLAKAITGVFDVKGKLRDALQKALTEACR